MNTHKARLDHKEKGRSNIYLSLKLLRKLGRIGRRLPLLFFVALIVVFSFGISIRSALGLDLLPFFCPDCVGQSYGQRNHVGGECFYTYSTMVKGKTGFYIVKSCGDPTFFEEFNYDNNFIYHLADTTWATYQNGTWTDAKCFDGRIAYSTYLNGAFGQQNGPCDGFTPYMGNEGNVWVPRYMNVGDTDPRNTTIVALAKESCTCCQAQYTGPTGRWVKLVSLENLDLGSGLGWKDVIRIAIMDGPGKGENFWYARNYGWVGFGHVDPPDASQSLFNVTHISGVDYDRRERQWTCSQPPPNCQVSVPGDHWRGEYYNNMSLSGSPSMVRDDGTGFLSFDWGSGSPSSSCGIGADRFSIRWTRTVNFSGGNYQFTVTADDGVRLWIDSRLKLDKWFDQAPATYTVGPISLSTGNHTIIMEYYENGGGAVAKLSWQAVGSFNFESGWEDGQVHGFANRVEYSKNVAGYFNSFNPPPECSRRYRETVHSGNYSLMIAGYSQASYAFCYYRVFDLNIPIVNGMKIGYWIYHAVGTPKVSVDGHFTDGTNGWTIRDFNNNGYLTDQHGVRIHPAFRRDQMNQWYYVEVDLSRAAGKTINFIMFAFDNGNDGFKGQYRAYVDDFRIFTSASSSPQPAGKSKLSIHTSFLGGESMQFIEQAQPTVVKILNNFGPATEVKQKSPLTLIVGRIWYDDRQRLNDGNPEDRAQEWWNNLKSTILANPAVDYWEGYNEPGIPDANVMNWYARFEKKRVEILAANGLKACIGNFSTGVPDVNDPTVWPAFYSALDAAKANGGVLGLHEYSAPTMDWLFDPNSGEGWLTGRYRKVYRQYLTPAGREIPLVITECGIDGGVGGGGAGGGWKNYQSPEDYFNQLKWYDSILEEDQYVLGATIFCLEIYGWESFDIRGRVRELLTDYVR